MENDKKQLCIFCNTSEATTKDHIPPKGIFPSPKPSDLITVPACLNCNSTSSQDDEEFKAFLSLKVGIDTEKTQKLWEESKRTLNRRKQLKAQIIKEAGDGSIYTPSGLYLGEAKTFLWDGKAHNKIITKITKGLHYHVTKIILPDNAIIKPYWFDSFTDELLKVFESAAVLGCGNDQFLCKYHIAEENKVDSMWLFQFHNKHFAGARIQSLPSTTP